MSKTKNVTVSDFFLQACLKDVVHLMAVEHQIRWIWEQRGGELTFRSYQAPKVLVTCSSKFTEYHGITCGDDEVPSLQAHNVKVFYANKLAFEADSMNLNYGWNQMMHCVSYLSALLVEDSLTSPLPDSLDEFVENYMGFGDDMDLGIMLQYKSAFSNLLKKKWPKECKELIKEAAKEVSVK